MTALAQELMTAEEFAVWAEKRPEKHWELFDGVPQIQQAQSWGRQQVLMALYRLLYAAIREANLALFVGTQGLVVKADPRTAGDSTVTLGDLASRNFAIVREENVIFDVIQRVWRKKAAMAVVVRGRGMARPGNVAGVITKEHVADSVASSIAVYPA